MKVLEYILIFSFEILPTRAIRFVTLTCDDILQGVLLQTGFVDCLPRQKTAKDVAKSMN